MGQKTRPILFHLSKCHALRNSPQSMRLRRKAAKLLCLLIKKRFWTIASYSSSKSRICGGQVSDRIGPDDSVIPPRGGITLQATTLRVI